MPALALRRLLIALVAGVASCTTPGDADAGVDLSLPPGDLTMRPQPDLTGLDLGPTTLWFEEASQVADTLYAVQGGGADDVYAIGAAGELVHSDGSGTWTITLLPTRNTLRAIWLAGRRADGWIVGEKGTIFHTRGDGAWTQEMLPGGAETGLNGVWASSPTDIYAVGNRYLGMDKSSIFHSTGNGTWTAQDVPLQLDPLIAQLLAVWGSGPNDLYVAGVSGTILHSKGDGVWAIQPSGTKVDLQTVWGSGAGDVYVGGVMATLLHSTGDGKWAPQKIGGTAVNGLWGTGAGNLWAAGLDDSAGAQQCALVHGAGGGMWATPEKPLRVNCLGVWGSSPTDLYAVGGKGTILHRRR